MTKLNRTNSKVHYKMYKAGKHWLYASLLTVGLMAGGAFGARQTILRQGKIMTLLKFITPFLSV